ncbi:MAG: WD40 repeat domain-containing protein [Gemmataceae bacterium]
MYCCMLWGRWLAVVLAVGLASLVLAQDAKPADSELGKLIDQLGNDDPELRKQAEKKIFDRGLSALDDLDKAIKEHADPDVKLRAILLASNIRKGAFGLLRKFLGHQDKGIRHILVSKDGKRVVTGGMDRTVRIWEVDTGKELKKLVGHSSWSWQIAFSPDEKKIYSASSVEGKTWRWDVETGKLEQSYAGHSQWVYGIAVTPDGKTLYSGGAGNESKPKDFSIRQFDVESGKEIQKLEGHEGYVWKLAVSPDGSKLASAGGNDNSLKIWDVRTGKLLHDLKDAHGGDYVVSVEFSPDSKTLLSGGRDAKARLWDVASGRNLITYEGMSSRAEAVAWSPDGKRFLVADGTVVHVLEKDSGKIIHRFEEHTDDVFAVAFHPDGQRAFSAGKDNVLRLWGVPK